MHYLKTWFFVDLISSVPLDYIYEFRSSERHHSESVYLTLKLLRLTKLLSLLRIFRVARLIRYITRIQQLLQIDANVISIVNLVVLILVFCHWDGCLQFMVPALQNYPNDSWVVQDKLVIITGNVTRHVDVWTMYTRSLWRGLSHVLSTGYGTTPPTNNTDIWMVIVSMLFGATFYTLFIAFLSNLVISANITGRKYNEMVAEVRQYLRFREVPSEIQKCVFQYYERKYKQTYFDEEAILNDPIFLSCSLRQKIRMHNCQRLLSRIPILADAPEDVQHILMYNLTHEIFFPEDIIIKAGDVGDTLYFIEHGEVEMLRNNSVVYSVADGNYFGEISLLLDTPQITTVKATEISEVHCLKKEYVDEVLKRHPVLKKALENSTRRRLAEIIENCEKLEDINSLRNLGATILINEAAVPEDCKNQIFNQYLASDTESKHPH